MVAGVLSPSSGKLVGAYRAISVAAGIRGLTAGQILATLTWTSQQYNLVLTRLSCQLEVVTAITTATPMDMASYVFRGAAGNSSGTGSTTLALTGYAQTDKRSMQASRVSEIRTAQGSAQALTADTTKTNDSAPFGFATWGYLYNTAFAGVAVKLWPGAAIHPGGWNDLYTYEPGFFHPLLLVAGEGVEIQIPTTANSVVSSGTVNYSLLWEWSEYLA